MPKNRFLKNIFLGSFVFFFIFALQSARTSAQDPFPAKPTVYLTFDADMNMAMRHSLESGRVKIWYEPGIINYFKSSKIRATFFFTGMFAEIYPDAVRDAAAADIFSIQNHSYDHAAFEPKCYSLKAVVSDQEKIAEIQKTQAILKKITGTTPSYFRYPGLCHSQHDDQLVRSLGIKAEGQLLVSGDAFNSDPKSIASHVLSQIRPGSVVVMHLGGPNAPATLEALKIIVPKLQKLGFAFGKL